MERQPLLSIGIPTYNREKFLDKCLHYLLPQVGFDNEKIEVFISDNASADGTPAIVKKYQDQGYTLAYSRNEVNLGPDLNIAGCFDKAKGKYVWIFSDDDYLLPGTLQQVISVLEEDTYGIVHLKPRSYDKETDVEIVTDASLEKTVYKDSMTFFKEYHYWATFITGNIINKSLIKAEIDPFLYKGTYLIQLGWIIPAVFANAPNVIVTSPTIVCKANNTGGYQLVKIFCKNYNIILRSLVGKGRYDKRIIRITNNELLASFFPSFLVSLLYSNKSFQKEPHFSILMKEYWSYKAFWSNISGIYLRYYIKKVFPFIK